MIGLLRYNDQSLSLTCKALLTRIVAMAGKEAEKRLHETDDELTAPFEHQQKVKSKKYMQKWKDDYYKLENMEKSTKGPHFAHCGVCHRDFSISHGGRNDITKHCASSTHKEAYWMEGEDPAVKTEVKIEIDVAEEPPQSWFMTQQHTHDQHEQATNAERCLAHREKVKSDPDQYEAYKKKNKDKCKQYYKRPLTEEELQARREQDRLRAQKYRDKKKSLRKTSAESNLVTSAPKPKAKTRRAVEKQREQWRLQKQQQRQNWTSQKWRRHRERCAKDAQERRNLAKHHGEDASVVPDRPSVSSLSTVRRCGSSGTTPQSDSAEQQSQCDSSGKVLQSESAGTPPQCDSPGTPPQQYNFKSPSATTLKAGYKQELAALQ
ncbi:DNA ligase 1-like isoform X2 [Littorina saxatilis]|uniref:DNA ligase 1-like isoform X2 n=1 Tax=Littorina saxatilis TaxID=31220 RepID=UPI0038B56C7D